MTMNRTGRTVASTIVVAAVLFFVLALVAAATRPVRAETATPAPPRESPKTPKVDAAKTATIATIAFAVVIGGIAGGLAIERRHLAAPAPGTSVRVVAPRDAPPPHEESQAP